MVLRDDSRPQSLPWQTLSGCSLPTLALVAQKALMVRLLILALPLLTELSEEERHHGR